MLRVIEPHDRNQQWLGVAEVMRAEAHEEANTMLNRFAGRVNGIAGITPESAIREGDTMEQYPRADRKRRGHRDARARRRHRHRKEGPGPLVSGLSKTIGTSRYRSPSCRAT